MAQAAKATEPVSLIPVGSLDAEASEGWHSRARERWAPRTPACALLASQAITSKWLEVSDLCPARGEIRRGEQEVDAVLAKQSLRLDPQQELGEAVEGGFQPRLEAVAGLDVARGVRQLPIEMPMVLALIVVA